MTHRDSARRAMVMLASEQLWPNIHGLVHWHEHVGAGLSDIYIYYTDDRDRSAEPARRLARFSRDRYRDIRVHLPKSPLGFDLSSVYQQVVAWQAELPDADWIINATGGLKPMFGGLLQCVDRPRTEVVYREFSGWFQFDRIDDELTMRRIEVDENTNDIPVLDLIKAQCSLAAGARWQAQTAPDLHVAALVEAGLSHDWVWHKAFRQCGYPVAGSEGAGKLFERFVTAALVALGVTNIQWNVEAIDAGQSLHEIDVVANHGGRLLIVDCKLRSDEEEGTTVERTTHQISQAESLRRMLGGLGAKLLLLRPSRPFSDAERMLAEAYRASLVDAAESTRLLSHLANFAGVKQLPPSLATLEDKICQWQRCTGAPWAFANVRRPVFGGQREDIRSPLVDVSAQLETVQREFSQDWAAIIEGGKVTFFATDRRPADELKSMLTSAFQQFGNVRVIDKKPKGRFSFELILRSGVRPKQLQAYLRPMHGQPFASLFAR